MEILKNGLLVAAMAFVAAGCGGDNRGRNDPPVPNNKPDLAIVFLEDGGIQPEEDAGPIEPNLCGDNDPLCQEWGIGPDNGRPFPLASDPMKDPNADSDGIGRNPNGWLVLDKTQASFQFMWLAIQDSSGSVAKIDTRTMKEVARYPSVGCYSLPTGSLDPCDGKNGCCAMDSDPQWQNRKNKLPEGPFQAVQKNNNSPSRTSVDYNGDLFVANRAFGGQASVTKIANDLSGCKDRNKNGRIDTSVDANKNGRIDPNDPKEFFGFADECILWTTNQGSVNATGRPLALGPGSVDNGPSDAYAGQYSTGKFVRIDGTTGKIKNEWQLPGGCSPYGCVIDSTGFGWAPNLGGNNLCIFDTKNNQRVKIARGTSSAYGVTLDRDQNIWIGSGTARYMPDRSKGWDLLDQGWWTRISGVGGTGIAADSRTAKKYFVWACTGNSVIRIPASDIPMVKMDQNIANQGWPVINNIPCHGVGVDADQNIVGAGGSTATRAKVDMNGDITQPLQMPPKQGELCPEGDRCNVGTQMYTYSDFTGFGLRNFTRPAGTYSYIVRGCYNDNSGEVEETLWHSLHFDADVPPNTSLTVALRSGPTAKPDQTWGQWTTEFNMSPVDLTFPGVLVPNSPDSDQALYLQVRFTLKTGDRTATPKLKSFKIASKCTKIPG